VLRRRRLSSPLLSSSYFENLKEQSPSLLSRLLEVFSNESCFMPFYWARVHSNGDMIFCPGHPDITWNVFATASGPSTRESGRARRHVLHSRLPICNRCYGLRHITS
jgi:hypothetical protein